VSRKLIIVLGPTASGKTDYSIRLAQSLGSPVISCDSRQIYREMSIGTAVPSREQLSAVRHYFIQNKSVTEYYTAGTYETEALELIEKLFGEGRETLVMCGGSMFYIDAVCNSLSHVPTADLAVREQLQKRLETEGIESLRETLRTLDPQAYSTMDLSNTQRVFRAVEICLTTGMPYTSFKASNVTRSFEIEKVGITRPREELYSRIDRRVEAMLSAGLVDEVRSLQKYRDLTALKTVGYREIFSYLDGEISLEKAAEDICLNTHHYAKRQLTWWKRDPSIHWITPED
jgi:tRNA dimethylallyltransferase